jgi:3D (Asp-Asp-Asp) domain-containing protein
MVTVTATAYDAPCRICHTRAKTESGRSAKLPGVASGRWPMGTVLSIQGIGKRRVDDRCRGTLDIRFTGKGAHTRARKFGRKRLKVKVIKRVHRHAYLPSAVFRETRA